MDHGKKPHFVSRNGNFKSLCRYQHQAKETSAKNWIEMMISFDQMMFSFDIQSFRIDHDVMMLEENRLFITVSVKLVDIDEILMF